MTNSEKLKLALGWIEAFHVIEQVAIVGLSGELPAIHFEKFEDFQRIFGGHPARIDEVGIWLKFYYIVKDGIEFVGRQNIVQDRKGQEKIVPHLPEASIAKMVPTSV